MKVRDDLTAEERKIIALDTLSNPQVIKRKNELKIQAENFGLVCHDVPSDGLCFYHSIAHQLQYGREGVYEALQLKKLADEYILGHKKQYQSHVENLDAYIKNPDLWADNIRIHALAYAMSINVIILRHDGSLPTIIQTHKSIYARTCLIGYEVGAHYQSLIPIDGRYRNNIIDMIVETASFIVKNNIKKQPPVLDKKTKYFSLFENRCGVAAMIVQEMLSANMRLVIKK